jgi:protein SCO1
VIALAAATAAAALALATPSARAPAYAIGDRVVASGLVTQDGLPFTFADERHRTTALSFVYTNCRDADGCPAVSARFARLQTRIDPRRVRLVLMTIAPREDTPATLRRYARAFRADRSRWSFVTGDPRAVAELASRFAIADARRDPDGALDHAERLIVLDGDARIAETIPGAAWDPDDALAAIDAVAGLAYDPLRRAAVHLTWAVEHTCGLERTGAAISLHHDAIALLLLMPPGPLIAFLFAERRRAAIREAYTCTAA